MQLLPKILRFFLVLLLIFSLNVPLAWGFDLSLLLNNLNQISSPSSVNNLGQAGILTDLIDIPSPTEAANESLNSLGFDNTEINKAGKQFTASGYKDDGPQVELTFTPAAPEVGKKITAIASTTFFSNTPNNQYFTWFLKTAHCQKTPDDCDYNKDGETNIEDYKIEAARLIASGNFQWQQTLGEDDPACTSTTPPAHCTLKSTPVSAPAEADNDGYQAIIGGDDQKGKSEHCFVRAPKDFKAIEKNVGHCMAQAEKEDEEIECGHLFPKYYDTDLEKGIEILKDEAVGDGHFGLEEEKFW